MTGTTLDDRSMGADPVFAEVVELVGGGGWDPREVWDTVAKLMGPDQSSVHVPGNLKALKPRRYGQALHNKRQAQVGLASNVVGIAAGTTALASAARDERLADKAAPKALRAIHSLGETIPKVSPRTGKAGALVAGGALGLQAANTIGDTVANRVLAREAKKKVAKGLRTEAKVGRAMLKPLVRSGPSAAGQAGRKARQDLAAATYSGNLLASSLPRARKTALVGIAGGAFGGGLVAGSKLGERKRAVVAAAPGYLAPKAKSTLVKSADAVWTGEISKVDTDKRQVFGWCSVTSFDGQPVLDRQDDVFPLEEMESSAYDYVLNSRKGGDMHARVRKGLTTGFDQPLHTSDLIESFVVTPEKLAAMGLPENALPHGWWVGFKVHDEHQWDLVKSGKRPGFSIHGRGQRIEKFLEER